MNILEDTHTWDVEKYKWEMIGGLVALIAIGIGVFLWKGKSVQPQAVQVLSATETNSAPTVAASVTLDVAGAVAKPGVYTLAKGARVEEAIEVAGGLATNADTNWIETNINRAELIRDGMKLYIPSKVNSSVDYTSTISANSYPPAGGLPTGGSTVKGLIDINSASVSELDTLSGVGTVTANKIISGRPYANTDELVSKKILNKSVFAKIKDQIRAW